MLLPLDSPAVPSNVPYSEYHLISNTTFLGVVLALLYADSVYDFPLLTGMPNVLTFKVPQAISTSAAAVAVTFKNPACPFG